jgi:hypothetical protein
MGEDLPVNHLPRLMVEIVRTRFEEAKQLFAERKKNETAGARLASKDVQSFFLATYLPVNATLPIISLSDF